jgi:pyruvate formate lyase activating enzyme
VKCNLIQQGYPQGSCLVQTGQGKRPACEETLQQTEEGVQRLISAVHLSRPENYLSIEQSGCIFSCRDCAAWTSSKIAKGDWWSPAEILRACREYARGVTLREPRDRATAYHAHESCRACGACVMQGKRSRLCPKVIQKEEILLSSQGWGPARNIVAFTGGDLTCCPEFYTQCAERIKEESDLWVLIETTGYGLTPLNMDRLKTAGVDSVRLDMKAFDDSDHKWLTGCFNRHILRVPEEVLKRGFVLEVASVYIPGVIEASQLKKMARLLFDLDPAIPFTVSPFFPEYQMKRYKIPKISELAAAYNEIKAVGLWNVRLGDMQACSSSEEDRLLLMKQVGVGNY